MSIKPVDFQVAIPRTTEASKISSNDTSKNLAMQQQSAESVQHKADISTRQVQPRSKSEEARINEKQRENRRNTDKEEKKENGEKSEKSGEESSKKKKDLKKDMQTSTIDIKI